MKKTLIYVGLALLIIAVIVAVIKVNKSNSTPKKKYKTEQLEKINIVNKVVATGKIIPDEEVEIKPQISGILDKIYIEEGVIVKKGDLIATVKVVPNIQSLNSATGRVKNMRLSFNNAKIQFERNKKLFEKGVISRQDFENSELNYHNAKLALSNALSDLDIIKKGSTAGLGKTANTNIRATTSGMVLEIPVKKGYQVIQSNNFNPGTTIATIADMSKLIFEGKVDEAEVGKLKLGMVLDITIGALENQKFKANLDFIAPKGKEENGAIQFKVKGNLKVDNFKKVRAGYSANASIVIQKKDSIYAIREALLQYDKKTKNPFVEVLQDDGSFAKKEISLGISDGIKVEILSGVTKDDKIKVWNKEAKKDKKK